LKYLFWLIWAWLPVLGMAQVGDSLPAPAVDTPAVQPRPINRYQAAVTALLDSNRFLNSQGSPEALIGRPRARPVGKAHLFYLLVGMMFFLALLRFIYARYFATLFTVFFNTSLRQGQLTDQLLQAKLPSLLYNLFFLLSGGLFIYLLLLQYGQLPPGSPWWLAVPLCIAVLSVIYGGKFLILKFTGWLTNYREALNAYTFVVFLINKIIGILLVPVVVVMALSAPSLAQKAAIVAVMAAGLLLLLRFIKSYGLLQGQIKVAKFHFLLYILGVEVLPLLLIYKGLVIYLGKN
jgi:hypothetical protein